MTAPSGHTSQPYGKEGKEGKEGEEKGGGQKTTSSHFLFQVSELSGRFIHPET